MENLIFLTTKIYQYDRPAQESKKGWSTYVHVVQNLTALVTTQLKPNFWKFASQAPPKTPKVESCADEKKTNETEEKIKAYYWREEEDYFEFDIGYFAAL